MATINEVAEKFSVNPEQVRQLKEGMSIVWGQIGYDCYEFADAYKSETAMVAEMTLDAGRLEEYTRIQGGDDDWTWLYEIKKNGHSIIKLGEETWNATY